MNNVIKWAAVSLILGYFLNRLCEAIQSDFLDKFLESNLILLLVAVLAINTATIGIILLRLGELSSEHQIKFPRIISAMKQSIWEQLALIVIGTICLIIHGSKLVQLKYPDVPYCTETVIIAVAIYAIVALYDTAEAAFALNQESDKLIKKIGLEFT
jgi:uncharacterized membrane protein